MWEYYGQKRPSFADTPRGRQESVWDYPRPPRVDRDTREVVISSTEGQEIARTSVALRLCETASPPQFYIPMSDVDMSALEQVAGGSFCEWKGRARYWEIKNSVGGSIAWDYPDVNNSYSTLREHLSFYPGRVHCLVSGEEVVPQPGEFYGGWITSELVGPFKGEPGTGHW